MASLGYARVSTLEQNADLQTTALEGAGCLKVYTDHGVSGTQARRPQLDRLLENARAGDELVVWKLDRLGRNTRHLLEFVDSLESRGIRFRSLTEGIATTGRWARRCSRSCPPSPSWSATSWPSAPGRARRGGRPGAQGRPARSHARNGEGTPSRPVPGRRAHPAGDREAAGHQQGDRVPLPRPAGTRSGRSVAIFRPERRVGRSRSS